MMRHLVVLIGIAFAGTSFAAETSRAKHHEVLLNYGTFHSTNYSNAMMSFNNGTVISIGGGYYYKLTEMFEIGPRMSLAYASANSVSATDFELSASGRVNVPLTGSNFENSFFGTFSMGFGTLSAGSGISSSVSTCLLGFEAGKRFELFPNFTWQPAFVVTVPTNSSFGSVSFAFRFLAASLVF